MINNFTRSSILGCILSLVLILFSTCQDKSDSSSNSLKNSFLALGDSYTIGESVDKDQRWPVQLSDSLRDRGFDIADPDIIAQTGWTTADLQEAIKEENPHNQYDLVSLLIGVNNQYQELDFTRFENEFEELLKQAVTFAQGNPQNVFVVSIPDYGVTPFGQQRDPETIAEELDRYNKTAQDISEEYEVTFINITPISEDAEDNPELTADDSLHPSGKMYQEWVSKMLPSVLPKLQ